MYDSREFPLMTAGNVYYNGARPYAGEAGHSIQAEIDPEIRVAEQGKHVYLHMTCRREAPKPKATLVTTELLGKARIPGLPYVNPDDSPLKIDTDYSLKRRKPVDPMAGPFESPGRGRLRVRVW